MATRRPKKTTTKTTTTKKPVAKNKPIAKKKSTTNNKKVVRKKVVGKKTAAKKKVVNKLLSKDEPSKIAVKRKMYEYEKIAENANNSLFSAMGKRVQDGEMRWAYYTTENDIGYHYYIKLK